MIERYTLLKSKLDSKLYYVDLINFWENDIKTVDLVELNSNLSITHYYPEFLQHYNIFKVTKLFKELNKKWLQENNLYDKIKIVNK